MRVVSTRPRSGARGGAERAGGWRPAARIRPGGVVPLVGPRGDAERREWDAVAPTLRAWWPAFEGFMSPVTGAMVAAAALRPGCRVLDVATGFGEPALTVADVVGPAGRVVATDLSPAMLAVAAERAAARGLTNVDFAVMDAQEPGLGGDAFDAVVCRLGLMFMPRSGAGLGRLRDLLAPGGRMVAAVWGRAEVNPWLTLAAGALDRSAGPAPAPPGAARIFDLGYPGVLEAALAGAGFVRVRRHAVRVEFAWASAAAFSRYHQTSPLGRRLAGTDPNRRARAWAAVTAAAEAVGKGGAVRLGGEVVVVGASSPGPA